MPNNNPQQQTTSQQQIARAAEGASKAAERLGESAEHATSVAIERVRQVRDEAQSGIEQQRDQVAERIRRLSGVLRAGSQTLSTDDPLAQQLFDNAGERIEQVADYISNLTPGDLADDITSLARRRPGLFFGGSFIIGLALGRFVKSSASAAASGSYGDDEDEYDNTLAVRSTKRGGTRKQRRAQRAQGAGTGTGATQQAATGGGASAQPSSAGSPPSSAATQPSSAKPAASTSSATGSTTTGTVGSGSGHGATSSPSYGASSSVTTASKPATSSSSAPASGTSRDVERGEGSKS